ncbi:MAG: hypothetical protein NTW01_07320 [Gammaproteobacteria bacterium]|nr:hypothetical protein [Gammaproteobacteria bacterium]
MNPAIAKHLEQRPITTLAALFEITGNRAGVYEAVANAEVYFDLERDYVMDDRAPVYRDRAIWEADRISRSKPPVEVGAGGTIDTRVGSRLVYDGHPFQVVSGDSDSVWIRGDNGSILQIALDSFPGLVNAGRIRAVPSLQTAGQSGLAKIVAADPKNLARALRRYSLIEAWQSGKSISGIPERSLRRYRELFREAEALHGHGLAGLLDGQAGRGNRTVRVDNRVLDEVKLIVDNELLTDIAPTIATAHRLLNGRLREKGLPTLSRKTFNVHGEAVDRERWARARFGHKAANAQRPPHPASDIPVKGDRAWEIAHIDSQQIDLELISERTGGEVPLAWLSVMLNVNPVFPLGWYIAPHKPNEESILMVARNCVRRHNRLPDVVVYDLGSEHRGTTFDVLRATYKSDFIKRPGGNPRFGPEIESFWNSINQYVIHQLKGNRG